jgi:hypothetical protein
MAWQNSRALELFINLAVSCKLFAIVKSQCFQPGCQRLELVHNGLADQVRCIVHHFGHYDTPAFTLRHGHNRTFVFGANNGVALPLTHLLSGLSMRGTLDQRFSVRELPSAVTPAGIAFLFCF